MKTFVVAQKEHNALAKGVAQALGLSLIEPQTVHFADSELRVLMPDLSVCAGAHAIVVHSTAPPVQENMFWLFQTCHALQQAGVKKITAVVPYLGYARQEKNPDGTVGAMQLIARLIEAAGVDQLVTVALHDPSIVSFFSIPVYGITLAPFLADFFSQHYKQGEVTLVAPDEGAAAFVDQIAELMKAPSIYFEKERYAVDKTRVLSSSGVCNTTDAVVIDDIIDTGSTIIDVGRLLFEKMGCSQEQGRTVYACAIHPVFSANAVDCLQESMFARVWVTNSIALPKEKMFEKLQVIDISAPIAQVVHQLL